MLTSKLEQNFHPISTEDKIKLEAVFNQVNNILCRQLDNVKLTFSSRDNKSYYGMYYFSPRREIVIYPHRDISGKIATLLHECVHALDRTNQHGHDRWFWYNLGILTERVKMAVLDAIPDNIDIETSINSLMEKK
jgi:hypothetical protein